MPKAKEKTTITRASSEDKKGRFIRVLAQFLAGDQAKKSILLDPRFEGNPSYTLAKEWADLRNASPLFGYGTVEEAEKQLNKWLRGLEN